MGDLRLGQKWSRWQRVRNDVWYFLAMHALEWVRGWRRESLVRAGRMLGGVAWLLLPGWRGAVTASLRQAYGGRPPVSASRVFAGLGEDLADAVLLLRDEQGRADVELGMDEASEQLLRALHRGGRGVVYATAHLGPMERMAAVVAERGLPVVTLARESYDPRFTQLYEKLRQGRGVKTIYRGRAGADRAIVRALRAGSLVGFPMDLEGRGMQCVRVTMLGGERRVPVGPARIALRTGAALVVGTPALRDGRMTLTVEQVSPGGASGDGADVVLTQRLAEVLERRIRALPEHWPWMAGRRGDGG